MTVTNLIKDSGLSFELDFIHFMHKECYYNESTECALKKMAYEDVRAAHIYSEYRTIADGIAIQKDMDFEDFKHQCEEEYIRYATEGYEEPMIQEHYFDVERHMEPQPQPAWKVAVDNIINLLEAA